MSDPFADIRPYGDEEVTPVLARLLHDAEFLDAIARLRLGKLATLAPAVWRPAVRWYLARELRGVTDIHGIQMVIRDYMERMIEDTTGGFSASGLEQLPADRPYLFMSNHRDITMDPAFTNLALNRAQRDTVRIAIGDNLLSKPWVSDLMRLNRSFIVKRSLSGPRELFTATRQLSSYIRQSLLQERAPIWIAQREGRAKDGRDRTEPAIIKMLAMSRDKQTQGMAEFIRELAIVPVAISYELDPCDGLKARELHEVAAHGKYLKSAHEDVTSIARGIAGCKGRVHVSFGTPLGGEYANADEVAAEIDRQVISLYCLHPTNLYAYKMLHGEDAPLPDNVYKEQGDLGRAEFEARISALPEPHRPYALAIYANAVVSKLELARTGITGAAATPGANAH